MDLTSAFEACVEQRLQEYDLRTRYAVVAACRYCEKVLKIDPKRPIEIKPSEVKKKR